MAMFDRFRYWWARRCAFNALIVSLENSPELWEFGERRATQKGVEVLHWYKHGKMMWCRYAQVTVGHKTWEFSWLKSRRIRQAMQRAQSYRVLKDMIIALKPIQTPLQIEMSERR